ncbi:DUF881 domain-containing protein [Fervidibacillus halotolerans]|uniref:DUF881 domain-containing protein n=1 Tax=Fervidibacillus halotolerans TaxID=2980027 RepID=A0A9E8RZZ6_9BACI|nr:DUF881 domain-containing protein [Fervidibacillus halotolerans]WAA13679.1 DUF881 domain-containing protein [Fervidibacillus halotolerans]
MKNNRIILSLGFLVFGFLIAYSYQITHNTPEPERMTDREWERNLELSERLATLEQRNLDLQNTLFKQQNKMLEIEESLADEEQVLSDLAKQAEDLRMILGKVKVKGEGVVVTLDDDQFDPMEGDINQFIVHEHHVLKVVNELYISGAEAISINGKRLTSQSYIVCTGPVITVDGQQFPAPFVIRAIGDKDTLEKALNFPGGVKDQLVADNIVVRIEKENEIVMNPVLASAQ